MRKQKEKEFTEVGHDMKRHLNPKGFSSVLETIIN
jgi:hypothetical protein